jgi:Bacterial extracellular solute-binding protein/von Willebrand factor type A domain
MAKHRAGPLNSMWVVPALAIAGLTGLVLAGALALQRDAPSKSADDSVRAPCDRPVRVVTATSFAPVLAAMTPVLDQADDCVRLEVTTADGRAAVKQAAEANADVWIPDDGSWIGSAGSLGLVGAPAANAGAVVAASPFYMVADRATGARLEKAGASWSGLARMVDGGKDVRLVVRDPAGSGDGLVAAGAVAEAVWLDKDMDASALWLARARKKTRTVTDAGPALPTKAGEVGVVPEYALLPNLTASGGKLDILPGTDHTAMLRYTWLPLTAAVADPERAAALDRLYRELTGPAAGAYLRTANLRTPAAAQGASSDGALPPSQAKPFDLLQPHHVDHVFATWYAADRRTNLLVAVDVSGSMGAPTGGSKASRIDLVRQGCRSLSALLPDDSRMGLWEFGSKLDGERDYHPLLGITALDRGHRQALAGAIDKLAAKQTGTGLYDTILAAYTSARDAYRPGVPNQVLIFTDGRNESDPNSLTAAQLTDQLGKTIDPKRPVLLSVVTFGNAADAKVVEKALAPTQGYVDVLTTADEVAAVFIHVAAGGLHH